MRKLICILLLAAIAPCLPAGELNRTPAGTFVFENKLYRFEVAADGGWKSLKIKGIECLQADARGFLAQPTLDSPRAQTLLGESEGKQIKFVFEETEFEVNVFDKNQKGILDYHHQMARHFGWAVVPSKNGETFKLPAQRLDNNGGIRFLSPRGVGFEMTRRTIVPQNSFTFGTSVYAEGGTFIIRPLAQVDPLDLLKFNFSDFPQGHIFPAGPIVLPTKLESDSPASLDLTLVTTLETFNTNAPSAVLKTDRQKVTIAPGATQAIAARFAPMEPGPYEFQVSLERNGQICKEARGTFIYDAAHWHYPDLEPKDFDAYWAQTLKEMRAQPLDIKYEEITEHRGVPQGYKYISFNGLGGRRVRGLIYIPEKLPAGAKVAAQLALPGAGYGAAPPEPSALSKGIVFLALSVHDLPWGGESGRHHPKEYHSKTPYQEEGLRDRDTYFYRFAYTAAIRAVEVLKALPAVDPARITVGGGSQGGSMALAVAAFCPDLEKVTASVPGRIRWELLTHKYRANCSFKPPEGMTREEMFAKVLAYYDIAYFARRIKCPVELRVSMKDEINPGPLQYWGYLQIPATTPKQVHINPWGSHG